MKNKRLTYIDLLEAIAIFFVLLYHSTIFSTNFVSEPNFLHYGQYYLKAIMSTCVPLFFFANGYLLYSKELDLRKHIGKMVKLLIQTMVWAVITLLLLQPIKHEFLSLTEFVKAIWHWKGG